MRIRITDFSAHHRIAGPVAHQEGLSPLRLRVTMILNQGDKRGSGVSDARGRGVGKQFCPAMWDDSKAMEDGTVRGIHLDEFRRQRDDDHLNRVMDGLVAETGHRHLKASIPVRRDEHNRDFRNGLPLHPRLL